MMIGSLTDDQRRHSPDYIHEENVQSALKKMGCLPKIVFRNVLSFR